MSNTTERTLTLEAPDARPGDDALVVLNATLQQDGTWYLHGIHGGRFVSHENVRFYVALAATPAQPPERTLAELADQIEGNHITSGSPGPLYSMGWSDANKAAADMIRQRLLATPAQPVPPPPAILADSLEDVVHQQSNVVRRVRATPAQPVAPLPPIVKVLAEWEDRNGSLAGILPSEWSGLWRDMTTAAVEQSPRQLRAALAASQPVAASVQPAIRIDYFDSKPTVVGNECHHAPTAAQGSEREALHKFLNAAAGEGFVLDGVDAADLYIALFPAECHAATSALRGEEGK